MTVGVLAAGLLTAFGGGTASGASTQIQATPSTTSVEMGQRITITGTVTPGKAGVQIVAQAQAGKVWRTLKLGVTGANGTYSITVLPTDPGVFQWRVSTRVNGKVTASSAPFEVTALRWYYLSEFPKVSGYAGSGAVRMNGTTYAKSVSNYYSGAVYNGVAIEYDLRRACTTLRTTAGILDDASSKTRTQLNILADGATLFSQEFGLGQAADVDLSIDEHLRLRLEWVTVVWGGASAFGNARILCAFRL